MSKSGLWSRCLRALLACGLVAAVSAAPGCSDPEVGSMPKMKKSKEETQRQIDGPERTVKKKGRGKANIN